MKAIETEYNGYKFRSRLEARWAVFFDALGIEYEYENEGYDLGGVRYLPDFWLPRLDLWVEVKGERLKAGSDDEEKIKRLVKDSRKPVAVFWGQIHTTPNSPDLYLIAESLPDWDTMKVCEALVIDRSSSWTECPVCHMVGLARYASPSLLPCGCCKDANKSPGIIAAYAEARKARFEYEEAKPKQKNKTSSSVVQQAQEQFKEVIRQMQDETKESSSFPDCDDVSFPDEPDKTNDVPQQQIPVTPLLDWDDVLQPSPSLTVEAVRSRWDYVKKRVKSKKDGAKISALLNGYIVVTVEVIQNIHVVIIQANADFFYNALSSGLQNNINWLPAIEWALKVELGCECKLSLKPRWNDVPQPSPSLTIEEVKSHWDYVKRRVKSKKDGAKISAALNGYDIVCLEETQELPVIILQAKADFFYSVLSSRVDYLATVEWAIKVELKQEYKIRLMEPQKRKEPQFKTNDLVRHHIFGEGVVLRSEIEGNTEFVDVQFDGEHSKKRLSMDFTKLENLGNPF